MDKQEAQQLINENVNAAVSGYFMALLLIPLLPVVGWVLLFGVLGVAAFPGVAMLVVAGLFVWGWIADKQRKACWARERAAEEARLDKLKEPHGGKDRYFICESVPVLKGELPGSGVYRIKLMSFDRGWPPYRQAGYGWAGEYDLNWMHPANTKCRVDYRVDRDMRSDPKRLAHWQSVFETWVETDVKPSQTTWWMFPDELAQHEEREAERERDLRADAVCPGELPDAMPLRRAPMNTLKGFAIGAEAVVVATLAVSSWNVAFAGHSSDWLAGAPLLTVVALEALRLPLAFRLPRLRLLGLACAVAMLAGLSVITGEAASLAFENLIFQRTHSVVEAERVLAKAEIDRGALKQAAERRAEEISRLAANVEAARRHRADIDRPLSLQAAPSGRTCAGKHGASWNCGAAVQAEAVRANAAAQKAHADELKDASVLVATAEARLTSVAPAPDMRMSDEAVADAKRKVADARAMNPMFRVAATWSRTPVEALTSEQFEGVKHYAVIALSLATALATALAAVVSSLPERGLRPGKTGRALRGLAARWRRRLVIRRDVPGPIEYQRSAGEAGLHVPR